MRYNSYHVRPIGEKVLVKLPPATEKISKGGIIESTNKTREQTGIIIELGSQVDPTMNLKIGDKILYELGEFKIVSIDTEGAEYGIVPQQKIIGVFENE